MRDMLTIARPETAPRTKLFKTNALKAGEMESRKLCSQSPDQGANIKNRPISKQKRISAMARRRFMKYWVTRPIHCSGGLYCSGGL